MVKLYFCIKYRNRMKITDQNVKIVLGLKVKQLRMEKEMSLVDLAQKSGLSVSYLNEIEKGKKYPKPDKLAALAQAFGVSYDWLTSLKLSSKLAPFAYLLDSNILEELPLYLFGIDVSQLFEFFMTAPNKLGAFVKTITEITRSYDLRTERFYFSVLRSYQEIQDNYFEEIEKAAQNFKNDILKGADIDLETLKNCLEKEYHIETVENGLADYPELQNLRSVYIPNPKQRLLLNAQLTEVQKIFIMAREIGYQFLGLAERPYTFSWVEVHSFEEVLNNFKMSYFAGAVLIDKDKFVKDWENIFAQEEWSGQTFNETMQKYKVSPETFLHRFTSLAPKFLGIEKIFFLKFNSQGGSNNLTLTKELHLSGLYNPHAKQIGENYCQRWVSVNVLKDLEKIEGKNSNTWVTGIQRSRYIDDQREYLVLSVAKPMPPVKELSCSVTIGIVLDKNTEKKINFINSLVSTEVNETCQRCRATDCKERIAPPSIWQRKQHLASQKASLDKLLNTESKIQK